MGRALTPPHTARATSDLDQTPTLGATSERSFIDPDPRAASGTVSYRVKAVRGADNSAWAQPIFFAIGGGSGVAAMNSYVIGTVARAA